MWKTPYRMSKCSMHMARMFSSILIWTAFSKEMFEGGGVSQQHFMTKLFKLRVYKIFYILIYYVKNDYNPINL